MLSSLLLSLLCFASDIDKLDAQKAHEIAVKGAKDRYKQSLENTLDDIYRTASMGSFEITEFYHSLNELNYVKTELEKRNFKTTPAVDGNIQFVLKIKWSGCA